MSTYFYKAREFSGKTITGTAEAENEENLIERLHRRNAVPLNITKIEEPTKQNQTLKKAKVGIKRFFNPVRLQDVLMFTHQLSAMFSSGIPLSKSLQSIARDAKNKHLQNLITDVYRSIEAGEDLSQAISKYPEVFDDLYVNLVRSGEVSGTLSVILTQIVSYIERHLEIKGKVKAAITYPVIIISFALLVITVLLLVIVPKFSVIYSRLKAPLPLPTKILLGFSEIVKQHFLLFIISVAFMFIFIYLALQTEKIGFWWDKIKLKIPIFGSLIQKSLLAKFTKTLSVLLQSGMPIIQSIQVGSNSVGNMYLQYVLWKCTIDIQKGASISQAFSNSKAFPDLLVQMISSGEESGTLHNMLEKSSYFYQQQVNNTVSALTSIIEPILIIIIGIIIACIAIAIFLPIFKIGGAL